MEKKDIVIALAGNPNSGKTSIYNFITGSRQHVGNYAGVTVERKESVVRVDDTDITFMDIPGIYSLSPYSPEEKIALSEIISERISGIIVVVDTTKIERNLYFAAQIIEIGKPVVIALNMFDEFESSGNIINIKELSEILGVPCVKTVGNRGSGIPDLTAAVLKSVRGEIPATGKFPHYSHEMEHAIDSVSEIIGDNNKYNSRWTAVNLLHYNGDFPDRTFLETIGNEKIGKLQTIRSKLESLEGTDINSIVTSGRYGYAAGVIAECLKVKEHKHISISEKIDHFLTHRIWGIPIFFLILWLIFQGTFTAGEYPKSLIQLFFNYLKVFAGNVIPPGFLQSLITDGIISGVGGVLVFLPSIILLFFFISVLEDTGYMSRAAFIMDRIMHAVGLHGKSFIPMLVGFGCTVPAIMATRTLENKRDRYITMFIVPFMSCGARLPVYILLTGAFFSPGNAGTVIFSIYIVGILIAFLIAKIISSFGACSAPFVMELPPYRIPTVRSIFIHLWERSYMYLRKAGTIILGFSIIMWFLVSFPRIPENINGNSGETSQLYYSYAGQFGKLIEPVLQPLGFDWRIGVALTAGLVAKEVVVSTLGTIYSVGGGNNVETQPDLKNSLKADKSLNPLKAYGLMLFILLYVPCAAVLGVLKREAGGWKWVILMVVYTISVAWIVSFSFIKTAGLFFKL